MNQVNGGTKTGNMASGYVRLNSRFFDEGKLRMNKHRLAQTEQVSYPTVLKYLGGDEDIRTISGDVLYAILVKGMGYSIEELNRLPISEIFEFVEEATK